MILKIYPIYFDDSVTDFANKLIHSIAKHLD